MGRKEKSEKLGSNSNPTKTIATMTIRIDHVLPNVSKTGTGSARPAKILERFWFSPLHALERGAGLLRFARNDRKRHCERSEAIQFVYRLELKPL